MGNNEPCSNDKETAGPALRALALAFAAVLLPAAGLRGGSRERVLLPVSVNGVSKGELLAFLEDGDIFLRVADLEDAGVRGFSGRRVPAPEGELVALGSLAPDVTFSFDTEAVALTLTTFPRYLGNTTRDLGNSRPDSIAYSTDTSAFVNYSVNWHNFKSLDAFAETGVSFHGNLLYASGSRDAQGRFTRGLTSYTVDDREHLTRWVVGDDFASAGTLGGALLLGGVGVSRNFELDPYFVRYPTFGLSGAVMTPSTADVYVNGAIVRREQLPPGQFDLTNLPVPAGSGNATVVIRDAFGGERTLASPFYSSSAVLARGLSEYTYNIGFVRRPLGSLRRRLRIRARLPRPAPSRRDGLVHARDAPGSALGLLERRAGRRAAPPLRRGRARPSPGAATGERAARPAPSPTSTSAGPSTSESSPGCSRRATRT